VGNAKSGQGWDYVYGTKILTLKTHQLNLEKAYIDTGTDALMGLDGTTAPGMALHDSQAKAVWASSAESGESYKLKWKFSIPDLTVTVPPGKTSSDVPYFVIKAMVSSSADQIVTLDGKLWINKGATAFDASGYALDAVSCAATDSPSTKNVIITLELTTAAKAALVEAAVYTLDLWHAGTADGTTEILHVWIEYK
jgi:hypothetical protein